MKGSLCTYIRGGCTSVDFVSCFLVRRSVRTAEKREVVKASRLNNMGTIFASFGGRAVATVIEEEAGEALVDAAEGDAEVGVMEQTVMPQAPFYRNCLRRRTPVQGPIETAAP